MSRSLGSMPSSASRTAPPTTTARNPADLRSRTISATRPLLSRPLSTRVPIQKPLEPVALPVQTLHQMLRLPRPRQVVIFPREDHQFRRHSKVLQSPEPLLALLDRDPLIVLGMQHQ